MGRKGERERDTLMWEKYIDRLPISCPQLETWPTTQAGTLTGNHTDDFWVCRLALNH